ncbi:hypothetical protein SH584_03960 [Sphingomonas sp. LY29]|nr:MULTISPECIES: hypothetical protein [unclassified Sphingomonas]MEA1073172.1 hypothetical protein [Sphingomonas sp. LY160]WRP26596.1 hypothetical protein SH584_03960 [Sphingomonas sp. LY29]
MAYTPRNPGTRKEQPPLKPINAWPLIAMLVVVVFLYLWFNGYLV